MEIRFLTDTSLSLLTACFNEAFSDYFVKFNATENYLRTRWHSAGADYDLSVGVFEEGRLVGFLITGIGEWEGEVTAYNAGTGIIPSRRGRGIVGEMYELLIPRLKAEGIRRSTLEVITKNERAIKAYKKVGFRIGRTLKCFKGTTPAQEHAPKPGAKQVPAPDWETFSRFQRFPWAWESTREAVDKMAGPIETWELGQTGYLVHNTGMSRLIQWGFSPGTSPQEAADFVKSALAGKGEIRFNNIDARDTFSLDLITALGFEPTVDQYEMKLPF